MRLLRPSDKAMKALVTDATVRYLMRELHESCAVEEILRNAWLTRTDQNDPVESERFNSWLESSTEAEAEKDRVSLLIARKMMPMLRKRAAQWEWRTVTVEE